MVQPTQILWSLGKNIDISEGLDKIVDLLDRHKIKATFFITCEMLEKHIEKIRHLEKSGHEIACPAINMNCWIP